MRKLSRKLIAIGLCTTLVSSSGLAYAKEATSNDIEVCVQKSTVQPRINWTGNAYLALNIWCNITSSNNIFADSPTVTSHASNPDIVQLRIINESGAQVGHIKVIAPGSSVKMDNIPAFSGTYTLQGRAITSPGTYTFSVD